MKLVKIVLGIILLFAIISVVYFKCINFQKEKISQLEDKISLLKEEHVPIRFKISEKTDDKIELTVKFYNADNKEIKKMNTSLPGQELSFDFYVVPVKDKYLAFPSKLFSNVMAASKGTELFSYYDNDGFPQVFEQENMDADLQTGLKKLFQHVKSGQLDSLESHFGNMVHDIKSFKSFMPGTVYSIVTHTKGGIEIVEE